ncbi:hypothetical protein KUL152_34650 [Tenacibaculum sp. KUL152]|nr:hypothetical protein KUL152_34650 [Tenacibaculum sp. KUL152]
MPINRIKSVLSEKNLTSLWLSNKLGKNTTTISRWCQNKTQPDLLTLKKISELLDVSIKELLI